jgi:hypothetical protein
MRVIKTSETYGNHLDTPLLQLLRVGLTGVSSDTSESELLRGLWVIEDGIDDGAALAAGGTENNDEVFCHCANVMCNT